MAGSGTNGDSDWRPELCDARHVCESRPHDGWWRAGRVQSASRECKYCCCCNHIRANSSCTCGASACAISFCKGVRQKEEVRQEEFQEEVIVQEEVKGLLLRSDCILPTLRSCPYLISIFCFAVEHRMRCIEYCSPFSMSA